ncbi:marine proteobacterial sortase target protein [Saccharophagus degradans]|uniref:Marine proteobacterial sortase target protein n=1 Tax=Saccharophagus degradans TaxID=86304 RepID=A0AAW7XB49_9GAMM|nr:marine proteobacterial sortase target protein [Saccharophagus degradans]MDO6424840.1 marine proteobacterial sortase target protein [Saccharophagus degradans]MDO6606628.1 marine proteobacterial sortase target protein [Saccharophagus degradans]
MNTHRKLHLMNKLKKARAEGIAWFFYALLVFSFSLYTTQKANAGEEPASGQLTLVDATGNSLNALHLSTHVDMQINGLIAKVTVEQAFTNNSDEWREGVYVFPLDEQAAVNAMEMVIGDRRIKGEIKEKAVAEKIYQQAKAEGKKASLVSQQRPNLFTQKVANIPPRETISVSLTYTQRVGYSSGQFGLRFPLTLTQRYIPNGANLTANVAEKPQSWGDSWGQEAAPNTTEHESKPLDLAAGGYGWQSFNPIIHTQKPTPQVPDAHLISPPMVLAQGQHGEGQYEQTGKDNRATISIQLDAGFNVANIESLYHQITINKPPSSAYNVELTNGSTLMDRDFVLQWRATASSAPQAAVFKETLAGEDYLLLMLLPPQGQQQHTQSLSRDIVFVVDTSGSMQGTSIQQAKRSLQFALRGLNPSDTFNIIEFDTSFSRFRSRPVSATASNVQAAVSWVNNLNADNGTEMYAALEEAFDQLASITPNGTENSKSSNNLQQVVFITDGAVGNEQALLSLIHRRLNNARLFTVAIGSAPNSYFMRKAAQFGKGANVFIGDTAEVTHKMNALLSKLKTTLVSDINVQWPQQSEVYPQRIPDLYAGEPLLLAAKTSGAMGTIDITGNTALQPWQTQLTINPYHNNSGVAQVWAKSKIDALEDSKTEGANPQDVRKQVVDVALTHALITPYTSFVAVEELVSRPTHQPVQTQAVANLKPQGQTVSYPKTATSATFNLVLGIGLLLLAFALQLRSIIRALLHSFAPSEYSGVKV